MAAQPLQPKERQRRKYEGHRQTMDEASYRSNHSKVVQRGDGSFERRFCALTERNLGAGEHALIDQNGLTDAGARVAVFMARLEGLLV